MIDVWHHLSFTNLLFAGFRGNRRPATAGIPGANLLRVRVELAVPVSAVIAITSATDMDGRDIAARELANSFSLAGYSTLFIDTARTNRSLPTPPRGLATAGGRHRKLPAGGGAGRLAVLTLNDITLKQTMSFRAMKAAIDILRGNFDYVVISTDLTKSAFGVALAATADAVLVSYQRGRRKIADDTRLAAILKPLGKRFLGMVDVSPTVIALNASAPMADALVRSWGRRTALPWRKPFVRAWSTPLAFRAAKADRGPEEPVLFLPPRPRTLKSLKARDDVRALTDGSVRKD